MSMLAEKRQKSSWVLNPRSSLISDSNIGQQMLKKMGWTPGKGLGINEQGMVNALRVKYKNDLRGLGCENKVEEWIKTQEEFNTLLEELGGGEENVKIGKTSLEESSKTIRSRVHYHKFTRGKDLCRYTDKDLESILGLSKSTKPVEEVGSDIIGGFSKNLSASSEKCCNDNRKELILSGNNITTGVKKKRKTEKETKAPLREVIQLVASSEGVGLEAEGLSSSKKKRRKNHKNKLDL